MTPILYLLGSLLPIILSLAAANAATNVQTFLYANHSRYEEYSPLQQLYLEDRPDGCPPCFNCLLPAFKCYQYANCNEFSGKCNCPAGFGGEDCLQPVCGSLSDGDERHIRTEPQCACEDGWSGINCNMCETDKACNALMPSGLNGTCYKGGLVVHENYQMCDVTNPKIRDQLKEKIPQVTFSCNREDEACNFQFWVNQQESFYCALQKCAFSKDELYDKNVTKYECETIQCQCISDRMLCGQDGSIDISDFLTEEIKGPALFVCDGGPHGGCRFEEPAMNELITNIFGDNSITLDCEASECVHYTELPDYTRPQNPANPNLIAIAISGALVFLLVITLTFLYCARLSRRTTSVGHYQPPGDEVSKLMTDHTPSTLSFSNISYRVGDKDVLKNVNGFLKPGHIMAIMGASGAGKTTLLDLLGRKRKSGQASGTCYLNGAIMNDDEFRRVAGFVEQEDTLMPSLTVFETLLYSARLRLPKTMSLEAQKYRVVQTMNELGIMNIRDSRIGSEGSRGISGGEKRRVSIACELVTSPSIIFMDEPTSGLDAFNAFNVIESLVTLAQDFERTIVLTIHQPRANIVSQFDQLVLLAEGSVVYSGALSECAMHFERIGHPPPEGSNIADYLVDLTMDCEPPTQVVNQERPSNADNLEAQPLLNGSGERQLQRRNNDHSESGDSSHSDNTLAESNADSTSPSGRPSTSKRKSFKTVDPQHQKSLIEAYATSTIAAKLEGTIAGTASAHAQANDEDSILLYPRVGWFGQFRILSSRALKNLYRNPMLLFTHYTIAIVMALLCGTLYYNVTNDISGFQNRLGLFFFLLALFGFSALTSLNVFASERALFLRERSNGYYAPISYFLSKVVFDVLPLRVIPPLIMGIIIYPMVGLVSDRPEFYSFLFVLVLFNLTTASLCLLIGILCSDSSVASLLGSLIMLFGLLFSGPLLNNASIPAALHWIQRLSIFHYAFEALLVNEVRYLTLTEEKFGLSVDVPGAIILSTFGFDARSFWPDVIGLASYFGVLLVVSYAALHIWLVERR